MPTNCMICPLSVQLLAGVCLHILRLCLCASIYLCPVVPPFSVIRSVLAPQSDGSFSFHSSAHSVSGTVQVHLMELPQHIQKRKLVAFLKPYTHVFIGFTPLYIGVGILYKIQLFQVVMPCNLVGIKKGWQEYGAPIFTVGMIQHLRSFVRYTTSFITCHTTLLRAILCKYVTETGMFCDIIYQSCLLQKVTVKPVATYNKTASNWSRTSRVTILYQGSLGL